MIKSYRSKSLRSFVETGATRKLAVQNIDRLAQIMTALSRASRPGDMDVPGWRFHSLAPGQKGRYSVWVNGNYRVTFAFDGPNAVDVDLEDYH